MFRVTLHSVCVDEIVKIITVKIEFHLSYLDNSIR